MERSIFVAPKKKKKGQTKTQNEAATYSWDPDKNRNDPRVFGHSRREKTNHSLLTILVFGAVDIRRSFVIIANFIRVSFTLFIN
mmetsp:Transcript_26129/g.44051  ORF Transcript_26129/g.44051 Transcript_26129/m.44051 type:complete len:84 (+) Transcript_26129:3429-3680(+)